jgi:dGTPase
MIRRRQELERLERQVLAPYAVQAGDSKGRLHAEPESATRTAFQRDRDRVLHTTAFRRLEGKTQVFLSSSGDHYRNRLTHTLEVAQVARNIARALGVNEDLTETIALAHDLGHSPFGHTGEDVLERLMRARTDSGFEHNRQTFRVVTLLEKRYADFSGLNLSWETLEGLVKHERDGASTEAVAINGPSEIDLFEPGWRPSLEASIADTADSIAYSAHDLDDGIRSGLVQPADLERIGLWRRLTTILGFNPRAISEFERRVLIREMLGWIINDVIQCTAANLERLRIRTLEDVRAAPEVLVAQSSLLRDERRELKAFLFEHLYRHPQVMVQRHRVERVLEGLFERFLEQPKTLPESVRARFELVGFERSVCDYLAGMTDGFAFSEHARLFYSAR